MAYHVSDRITMDFATDTLLKLKKKRNFRKAEGAFIHSDQGTHYTHPDFQKLVKKLGFGNLCQDEETVGITPHRNHSLVILRMKPILKPCTTLDELKRRLNNI